MENTQQKTFQNATGKIDYTLTNDYMFRAVLQKKPNILKELCAALLHLDSEKVKSTVILNPIEIGKSFDAKTYVLDVKVLLNNATIINLEMQVLHHDFWSNRSLSYLCSIFNNLKKGEDYSQIKPVYHIGIVDFSPFPDYPEFYAVNKITNLKYNYIYNDNFTLNVLDLNQIERATEEDKAYRIDHWAKLFKAQTWEDFKMLAQKDVIFEEACEAVYNLNQDDQVRYWCEAREDGERILLTYQNQYKRSQEENARQAAIITEQKAALTEQKVALAEMQAEIMALRAKLEESEKQK